MEYTKDVIFNIKYLKNNVRIGTKIHNIMDKLLSIIKQNKFILSIMAVLIILISVDIILVNSFIALLAGF